MLRKRWTAAVALVALLVATMAVVPGAAYASEKGRKNTAMALGAAAAFSLLTGKSTQGLILGAGGVYAYKKYQDKKEENRTRDAARRGYRVGYQAGRARR